MAASKLLNEELPRSRLALELVSKPQELQKARKDILLGKLLGPCIVDVAIVLLLVLGPADTW